MKIQIFKDFRLYLPALMHTIFNNLNKAVKCISNSIIIIIMMHVLKATV